MGFNFKNENSPVDENHHDLSRKEQRRRQERLSDVQRDQERKLNRLALREWDKEMCESEWTEQRERIG